MTEFPLNTPNPDLDRRIFDKIVIESANSKIGVNPDGGYVTSWRVKNQTTGIFEDILYIGSEIKRTGIPILFPNYGEGKGVNGEDMYHGFGRNFIWTPDRTASSPDKIFMELGHDSISDETRAKYPFEFNTTIEVQASPDGSLVYSLNVKNEGQKDMPITPGLHPYWAIPHTDKSRILVEGIQGFDATSVDWDTTPPDTVYDFDRSVEVQFPSRQIMIEDISSGERVIKHLVVWSQTPQKPDFNFVCFEPITARGNNINTNPILVPSLGEWNMRLRFSSKAA